MKKENLSALVDEGLRLKRRIKSDNDRLKEISAALIAAGVGEYQGKEGKAVVIAPGPAIKPDTATVERLRPQLGDAFGKLFDRVVTWKPVKDFRGIAGAILTPAKSRKLIEACEQVGDPYVKFS